MALVLVAEDRDAISDLLARFIHYHGHTVITATDGETAYALALQYRPYLIISDVMMPLLNGCALVQALRANPAFADTRIYVMSGEDNPCPQDNLIIDGYLVKPFGLEEIEAILQANPPRHRLLLVDDDPISLKLLAETLKKCNYDLTLASSGTQAIAHLQASCETYTPYTVVLTDMCMPGMDGFAISDAATTQAQPPVIILVTGFASIDTAVTALRREVFDYIRKPYTPALVQNTVQRAILYHQARGKHLL